MQRQFTKVKLWILFQLPEFCIVTRSHYVDTIHLLLVTTAGDPVLTCVIDNAVDSAGM